MRSEKRLVRREHAADCDCDRQALAAMHGRWCADTPDLGAARAKRERVELVGQVLLTAPSAVERDADVLGAAGAWLCVGISVVLLVVLGGRQLWLWLL